jgi:ribosomal protein S10
MKLEVVYRTDEDGNTNPIDLKTYLKLIVEEQKIKPFASDKQGQIPSIKVAKAIFDGAVAGQEQPDELADNYSEAIEAITSDVEFSKAHIESEKAKALDEKEAAKKQKEEEKAKKEKEAAELALRQDATLKAVSEGADIAASQFISELEAMKSNLPDGVTIVKTGDGYSVALAEGATDESIGKALGYFIGAGKNSEALNNQIQFYIGDLAGEAVNKGLFKTSLEASKVIAGHLDAQGKRIAPGVIETYRRMAERTPAELRNPKADPTAYLELSRMKRPKKGEKETKEAFEKRKDAFDADILELQKKLADGTIETRKAILEPAQEIKYKHGIEERPNPNEVSLSTNDLLRIVVIGEIMLENCVGVYKDAEGKKVEDSLCFTDPENAGQFVWVTEDELAKIIEEAKSSLMNILLIGKNHNVEEALQGFKKEEKEVPVGMNEETKKAITEKRLVETPVILPVFFPVQKDSE